MPATRADKAAAFQALHRDPGTFVIANAWDGGAARVLQGLGFAAIATSSGAAAGVLGRLDGKITREEALAQARNIVAATELPVSADLEKGFGDTPQIVLSVAWQPASMRIPSTARPLTCYATHSYARHAVAPVRVWSFETASGAGYSCRDNP